MKVQPNNYLKISPSLLKSNKLSKMNTPLHAQNPYRILQKLFKKTK